MLVYFTSVTNTTTDHFTPARLLAVIHNLHAVTSKWIDPER